MVTRRTKVAGSVIGPAQRISLAEAIHVYTYCSAWTQFAEHERGRLLPGMAADISVLSRDILAEDIDAVLETKAEIVLRGGEVVLQ